jgi:ArsR family transcriptional regulator, lead/cadmium/zinc/bismuth-responsive transcriptional repressor
MSIRSDDIAADSGECEARIVDASAVGRCMAGLPSQEEQERLAALFTALGDPTRARLLLALADEEMCVCDLAEIAGVSQSAVSHQLRTFRELRLVAWTRDGKRAVYRLADDHVRDLLAIGLAHASEEAR